MISVTNAYAAVSPSDEGTLRLRNLSSFLLTLVTFP